MQDLIEDTARRAIRYLEGLKERSVARSRSRRASQELGRSLAGGADRRGGGGGGAG